MPQPQTSLRPLSVGNVVTAAIQLFRSHFKQYLSLTLRASLWGLVPVYGWAKSLMISALISRLSFGDLTGQPESETEGIEQLEGKKWEFLTLAILVGLISGGVVIGFYIVLIILGVIAAVVIPVAVQQARQQSILVIGLMVVLGILAFLLFLVGITWIYSRLMISELPLAIESPSTSTTSIGRSWQLTKNYVFRIQGIIIVSFLLSLPLYILAQAIAITFQLFLTRFASRESATFFIVSFIFSYLIGIGINLFILPFWQVIKAVIYYDVRNRSEGLGLEIRDRS
jgi:hypothetical protein